MTVGDQPAEHRLVNDGSHGGEDLDRIIEWAFDHTFGEAIFDSADLLLVGDAEVVAAAVGKGLPTLTEAMGWITVDDDRALMIRGPGPGRDGPWVWVMTGDDGPITSVDISPGLFEASSGGEFVAGSINVPSGRLVVGTPTSIAWRGASIEPSGTRQAELFYDGFIRGGGPGDYLVVVRLPEPGSCVVVVVPGATTGQIAYAAVDLPRRVSLPRSIDPAM